MEEKKMQVGSLHHQMTTVKDMDEAIHLYQDVLGLTLTARLIVPNDALSDDVGSEAVWGDGVDHVWEIATLDNGKGAPIELCHPLYPAVVVMDKSTDYGFTGHTEQGFAVEDINAWYKWIVDNGYRPQSEPWEAAPGCMTFTPGLPKGDFRTPEQKAWAEETYR